MSIPPYRYFRIHHPANSLQLSELETYDVDTTRCYYGKLFLPESHLLAGKTYDLYNRDITDYEEIKNLLCILPRTDSNHIMAGDVYELFFYQNFTFQSLAEQKALTSSLTFEQVPAEGLYLLKDKTRGTEHRIFTYKDGQVFFW
mgnify:CR=1 FL=1